MVGSIIWLFAITWIPALELRASIPIGIFSMADTLSWPLVVLVCVVSNILVGSVVFLLLRPAFGIMRKWHWFENRVWPFLERTQKRIHPYVEKYGELGVAVFIGIPLPGSGVYSGALGAYLIGLGRRKFFMANVLGVLIAGAAVTVLCLLIFHGAVGENSWLAKLFIKKEM